TLFGWKEWVTVACLALFTAALAALVLWRVARRDRLPLFFLAWFAILLAPVLPFPEHRLYYLATLPAMGIAMLWGYGVASVGKQPGAWRWPALAVAFAALGLSAAAAHGGAGWWRDRTRRFEALVAGVARARELHPHQAIVLAGLGPDEFWGAMTQGCFALVDADDVYLAPGSERRLGKQAGLADPANYTLDPYRFDWGLAHGALQVYEADGPRLRNVTSVSAPGTPANPPRRLDVGNPFTADLLGSGWHAPESGFRWMARRATLRLGGPRTPREKLYVSGYISEEVKGARPLELRVRAGGVELAPVWITKGDAAFAFEFALSPELAGRPEVEIEVEVERASVKGGVERGAVFGVFEFR
ncbi:MAG TPA: hypothetical protein VF832_12405, partial [Longimicrobiales bacterium]